MQISGIPFLALDEIVCEVTYRLRYYAELSWACSTAKCVAESQLGDAIYDCDGLHSRICIEVGPAICRLPIEFCQIYPSLWMSSPKADDVMDNSTEAIAKLDWVKFFEIRPVVEGEF